MSQNESTFDEGSVPETQRTDASSKREIRTSRRALLLGGAGVAAAFGGIGIASGLPLGGRTHETTNGSRETEIDGEHQPGIDQTPQSYATFVALDLLVLDATQLSEFLADIGSVATALMKGENPPEKTRKAPGTTSQTDFSTGLSPARLSITVGLGPSAFLIPGVSATGVPSRLRNLPSFSQDSLDNRWSGGEMLIQICADDAQIVSAALRSLRSRIPGKATMRWTQNGFISHPVDGGTARNMFGQKDGTANPEFGSEELSEIVWALPDEPAWFAGGTYLVFRKIRMKTAEWDLTPRDEHDEVIGRRRADGAPLTGQNEFDTPDFEKAHSDGTPVIPIGSHIRQVHGIKMLRRSYSYDYGMLLSQAGGSPNPNADEEPADHTHPPGTPKHTHGGHDSIDNGLLFCAYGNDPDSQFIQAQHEMDRENGDLLNRFIQTTGSGIFAILPGANGRALGSSLFSGDA